MNNVDKTKRKKRIRHLLLGTGIGLGVIGLGFGWWYFFGKGKDSSPEVETDDSERTPVIPNIKDSSEPRYALPKMVKAPLEKFPIKYGDKGAHVKRLQEALIKQYGRSILPNYGADGGFFKEMAGALKSKGFPQTIDKPTYEKIIAGQTTSTTTPVSKKLAVKEGVDIAKNIWLNAMLKRNDGMVDQLRRIRHVEDYRMVDALMKTVGQRKSVAQVAEEAVTDDTGKQLIVSELKRIGLKYKDEKWVLSGIEQSQIISCVPTVIRDRSGAGIEIPAETLLGVAVSSAGDVTSFRTIAGEILYVPTKNIYHV